MTSLLIGQVDYIMRRKAKLVAFAMSMVGDICAFWSITYVYGNTDIVLGILELLR